jgi:hypothetical protein
MTFGRCDYCNSETEIRPFLDFWSCKKCNPGLWICDPVQKVTS